MWFKNLKMYTLTQELSIAEDDLRDALNGHLYRPCGGQDMATLGFAPPFPDCSDIFHKANGIIWIALKQEKRILPTSVVNDILEEKVAAIEFETGAPVGKKAKADLKNEIIHQLMPRTFTKRNFIHGFISVKDRLVVVDTAADGVAETFLAMVRKAVGSLPVVPLARRSLSPVLTDWLTSGTYPEQIALQEEADLESTDDTKSKIAFKKHDLESEEVQQHLNAGKVVSSLSVCFSEACNFVLTDDCTIKRLKFSDRIKEESDDIPKNEIAARMDAEFALSTAEIVNLVSFLRDVFSLSEDSK